MFKSGLMSRMKTLAGGESLRGRAFSGGLWLTAASGGTQVVRFLRNVLLVRLLAREDFGLMATALAVTAGFEAFVDVGIRQCVIQHERGAEDDFLNAVWWFSAIRGAILFAAVQMAAPMACQWMGRPDLLLMMRIVSVSILLRAVSSPRIHVLEKQMSFRTWALFNQSALVIGVILVVPLALAYRHAVSLAIGFAAENVVRAILSYRMAPFVPRFRIERGQMKELLKFAGGMAGVPIMMVFVMQADMLAVGKMMGMDASGGYLIAAGFATTPVVILSGVLAPLVLPVYSQVKENAEKLRRAVLSVTWYTGMIAIPIATLIVVIPKSLLSFFYSARYADMGPTLAICSVYMLARVFGPALTSVYLVAGKPNLERRAMFARSVTLAVLMLPCIKYMGLPGAALSQLAAVLVGSALQLARIRKMVGFGIGEYMAALRGGVAVSAPVAAGTLAVKLALPGNDALQVIIGGALLTAALALSGYLMLKRLTAERRAPVDAQTDAVSGPSTIAPAGDIEGVA